MRKYFITGLVILLPLAVTVAIIIFVVNFLTTPFIGLVTSSLKKLDLISRVSTTEHADQILRYASQILILICIFAFTLLLGLIARWFFFKSLISLSDKILHRIPIVNKVYKTTQEIIRTLFVSEKNTFRQVVMAPFPNKNSYVVGLVSRESPKVCSEKTGKEMYSVLIPTTPNPTTGFLLMYPKEELIFLDMKPEEAIKYIVSCGVITPEKLAEEQKEA